MLTRNYTPLSLNNQFIKVVDDPNLKNIPRQLPNTRRIDMWFIGKRGTPHSKKTLYHLHSFKDLPERIPILKNININNSIITNFEDLNAEMPKLDHINLSDCRIHNFHGIPSVFLSAHNTTIDSFEGLELPIPQANKEAQIYFENCIIRSLGGISRLSLQSILIAYFIHDDDGPEDNTLNLTEKGRQLVYDSINPEIYATYNPLNLYKWVDNVHGMIWQRETRNNLPHREWDSDYEFYKDNWIYGFHLENELFIPEKLELLHQYYHKTTRQLAQEYIARAESLLPEQIERLVHEADPEIRKMLENNLSPSDSMVKQLSAKFSFETQNKLKILK